jgi:hypothetical protein
MKKNILFFIAIWFCNIANAQNFNSHISSTIGSNEGGQLNLTNSIKIGKNVKTWTLFNMTGAYGNGLNFWAYAADGTNLGPKMTLSDDGNLNVNTGSIFSRNGSVYASTNSNEGPFLSLINPGKIANGIATDWRIYNMTGHYGNSLQFWNYDTVGCVSGGMCNNRFTLMDNGNVGIGTTNPSNSQGWNKVLDVAGSGHAKILATSDNATFRTGLYSHSSWHGGGGFVGTESNHTLFLMAGYDPKMTVLTNGNVGIGTNAPDAKLDVNGSIQTGGGANNFYGFGESSASKPIDVRTGPQYPYVFNWHTGLTFSAHSTYGGIRFYNQGYPNMYGEGVMVMAITNNNVGIGTTAPDAKLAVKGQIHAQEVKVDLLGAMVPDYVFAKEYKLKSLAEVEAYVKTNSHLPEVPSAKEIEKNGLQLGEMNMVLLKKIEELTLHAIEQQKQIELLKTENNTYKTLAERLTAIEKELTKAPKQE